MIFTGWEGYFWASKGVAEKASNSAAAHKEIRNIRSTSI